MKSVIRLQDPDEDDAPTLLEAMVEDCEGASSGGAMFAFGSPRGIQILFNDPTFRGFVADARFDLVVGVDSITNEPALQLLKKQKAELPGLSVSVFLHQKNALFHPKFAWFAHPSGGRVVVGSGNLTTGGLTDNWEGFLRQNLGAADQRALQNEWTAWKNRNADRLKAVDDPAALERARKNKITRATPSASEDPPEKPVVPLSSAVLVAEIPKSGDRWRQANFNAENFRGFFQLEPGTPRRVLLYPVDRDGTVGEVEVRPSVSVKSNNYRIELGAAHGLEYPADGKPVGIFLRIGVRKFQYLLVMPSDSGYASVSKILKDRWQGPSREARRVRIEASDLAAAWPKNPLVNR